MILDLFAGPGGWDVAARQLGLDDPLGVEMDQAACDTRSKAKLRTWQGDVRAFLQANLLRSDVDGLIASPPCQTFSMAGKGAGRDALDQVLRGIDSVAMGQGIAYDQYEDIRTGLVLEPLQYALELEPEWMAWEQVPTVQPVWDACADVLRADGYSVWTGRLQAEQYGVPQTRKRSVLLASRTRTMTQPPPTHSRFYSRSPQKLDPGVAKWVSMAEALGWDDGRTLSHWRGAGMTERYGERPSRTMGEPAFTMAVGGTGSGALRWMHAAGVGSFKGDPRTLTQPAATITGKGTAAWSADGIPGGTTIRRVSHAEAAALQSFPADHPWQGTSTKQYQQIGNAIPPGLALHVLAAATGVALPVTATEVAA